MQPGKKRLPKLTKQSLPNLHVIYKCIILKLHVNKLHINTFAKIIIIEDVLCAVRPVFCERIYAKSS